MNPYVSVAWSEIAVPAILLLVVACQFWLHRRVDLSYAVGSSALVLSLAAIVVGNLFYQGALHARAWPTAGMFDQVVVTADGDAFVKLKDPILGRKDRIQRYSCRGEFKVAFQPDSGGGLFKFAVDPGGTLSIYSVRTNTVDTFGFGGEFLGRREMEDDKMPFDFLKPGPSVMKSDSCELVVDPDTGRPLVRHGRELLPLERGDWVLEYIVNRNNIIGASLLGGLFLLVSLIRERQGNDRTTRAHQG